MSEKPDQEDTRTRIIDLVEQLIMERGFNAISYQDIAAVIGIRKASIHYHFPSKGDLGVAAIERYNEKLSAVMVPPHALEGEEVVAALERFPQMFVSIAGLGQSICLAGVLGAEFETLPAAMQRAVQDFYAGAASWLEALIRRGRETGVFFPVASNRVVATSMLTMLEGALIAARVQRTPDPLADSMSMVWTMAGIASPTDG